jgi:hypothetical protein
MSMSMSTCSREFVGVLVASIDLVVAVSSLVSKANAFEATLVVVVVVVVVVVQESLVTSTRLATRTIVNARSRRLKRSIDQRPA